MDHTEILGSVELFEGITPAELQAISLICKEITFKSGEVITRQGETGEDLYIVLDGYVEVLHSGTSPELSPRTIVHLGKGQIFGEMALVDHGPRSATVRAASDPTKLLKIHCDEFEHECEENHHLGYVIMRNIAADLSFKLRHRHFADC
ncbi:MAG: cyclic nucleotide-binding domain-containing protein [Anaerolineales bacterium]|nr:cyclic nucleotide-binding domain-containing protein [Anaerolineales bacterium]